MDEKIIQALDIILDAMIKCSIMNNVVCKDCKSECDLKKLFYILTE